MNVAHAVVMIVMVVVVVMLVVDVVLVVTGESGRHFHLQVVLHPHLHAVRERNTNEIFTGVAQTFW